MEIKHGKHVRVICDLNIGDEVYTDGFGYHLDGKKLIINDIQYKPSCESGFMVKVNGYPRPIDSNWVDKK